MSKQCKKIRNGKLYGKTFKKAEVTLLKHILERQDIYCNNKEFISSVLVNVGMDMSEDECKEFYGANDVQGSEGPKYSDNISDRAAQMEYEKEEFATILDEAPIGHILNLIEMAAKELVTWEGTDGYTKLELKGLAIKRIVDI